MDAEQKGTTMDDAVASLLAPEPKSEPVETESEDTEAEAISRDEAPDDATADADEVEAAEDDTDAAGDEDGETDDTEEEAEADEEPQLFTVKVRGEEKQVTLEELTRSYSGQAHITQGMQEAAAAKKEAEALKQTVEEQREQLVRFVQGIQQTGVMQAPQMPPLEMRQTDPIGYMEAKDQYDRDMLAYQQQQQQLAQLHQQRQAETAAQRKARLAEEGQKLAEAIPDFADAEKAPRLRSQLVDYARSQGLTDQDLQRLEDHRAVVLLHKAMLYDTTRDTAAKAKEKIAKARPVVKGGTKGKPDPARKAREEARKRLKASSGRDIDAAVNLILE